MTDEEFQDLKRENFNLKLRIYFLEEQIPGNIQHQTATTSTQQLENEIEGLRRRLQSPTSVQTSQNFDWEDERRALRSELEKYREENQSLRKSIQLNSNQSHVDEREKLIIGSFDSGVDSNTLGMSSTFLSSSALQVELSESRERERKLEEKIQRLRQQLDSSLPQADETLAELDRARRKIQHYEAEIQNYAQQQNKAERVLQRLQVEYESRIAHLVEQQRQQTADFEAYRHEPLLARIRVSYPTYEQTSSNVNIEDYRQTIDNRDRIIQELEQTISELTRRLRTPFTVMPSIRSIATERTDEHSQILIQELNAQLKVHLETIDQLRAECVELRRGEAHLRNQVDSLTHLISAPVRHTGLPPVPRPSAKTPDQIQDAQRVEDLQTAVVQITLQLQSDAENVSGLTNRVAQIIRDRDEWQEKINRLQAEIEDKDAHIRHLERREPEVEDRIRQQFTLKIESLHREINALKDQLHEREHRLNDQQETHTRIRKNYERVDTIHLQEIQALQNQLKTAQELVVASERQFDDLQRDYAKIKNSAGIQTAQLEREIQQQRRQIEEFNVQYREVESSFQLKHEQLERERDFERQKSFDLESQLDNSKRRLTDVQNEYDRFRSSFDDQRDKFEHQIRIYQTQISQFDRERDQSDDEVQTLRRENQALRDRARELENRLAELSRKSDEFKSQISTYEIRFQDTDDTDKRNRNEITRLQRDIQEIARENEDRVHELSEWRRKYELIQTDLKDFRYEKERVDSENQTIHRENTQLKHDLEELSIRIRLEIQREFEEEYRQLISVKDSAVQNIQKDNEAIRDDFEQLTRERTRLADRLQAVESSLKQANETIETYEADMNRLRQALQISNEKNEQIEYDLSRAYTDELKVKTERLQDLDNRYRSVETQLHQYETTVYGLQEEKAKLQEYNNHLQREYDQYRTYQQDNYDTLQRQVDDANTKNLRTYEERVRTEVVQATASKQDLIAKLENELREKEKIIKELEHARSSYQPKDLLLELEIQIEGLKQEVETKERFIKTYTKTVQDKEEQIVQLLDNIHQGDTDHARTIESLREDLQIRERKFEQLLKDKNSTIHELERQLSELQTIIRDSERDIVNINEKFRQSEQKFDTQQRELEDYRQKRDILSVNLNVALEENETHLEQIKVLKQELAMHRQQGSTPDQIAHYQSIIDDLRSKLRQREDSIQSLQRTIADSERDLRDTRQNQNTIQSDYNRAQLRVEQMQKQYEIDLENREQIIASLRRKLTEKDEEINKLRENDIAREAQLSNLRSRIRDSEPDSKSEYSGARAPPNVALVLELQKRESEVEELRRELERVRREKSSVGREDSSIIQRARLVEIQRPHSRSFENLNREELLYELEMALQDNKELVRQLEKKTPNITELHNQLLDVRKELARQKYVNQVLWRKLDALMDIQGSNTRAELAIELANYHDELEALKAKQHRVHDTRVAMLNPLSRSSSGLTDSSSVTQRRHISEDLDRRSSAIVPFGKAIGDQSSIEELQEMIRNQNKYIEQLQIHVRINKPDVIQTSASDRLMEENQNLHLMLRNCRNELQKLYKTIQLNEATLVQYENVIKQQQYYIEQFKQSSKKHNRHLPERNGNKIDDLIINLDIDILSSDERRTETSLNKKDSGVESVVESTRYNLTQQEYQRQITEKDDRIKQLTKQLNDSTRVYENELQQYRIKSEKAHTDLIGDLDSKQNDLRQARLQIDLLKSTKTQLEQAQDQNQRMHSEINLLQNELASKKDLLAHYERQISILEKQVPSRDRGTGEMSIRTSEMSELLEEMRRLRHDLQQSINKQRELQAKLDENIRLSRTPREFSFSGRGVSYPELRLMDASGVVGTESFSFVEENRSRPLGSSTTELEAEPINLGKMYIVGELESHEALRKLITDMRIELKALEVKIKEKLRSKFTSSLTEPSIEWLEHRLKTLTQCLARLEETYQLIEAYWKAKLPVKNSYDEHPFNDPRLATENHELKLTQTKYLQELQTIRQRYKEQSVYMDQVLAQLTKSNNKKANSDDYLALLLRPTLDVLQKARSNMEHHLKETNLSDSLPSQRRHRTNRLD